MFTVCTWTSAIMDTCSKCTCTQMVSHHCRRVGGKTSLCPTVHIQDEMKIPHVCMYVYVLKHTQLYCKYIRTEKEYEQNMQNGDSNSMCIVCTPNQ